MASFPQKVYHYEQILRAFPFLDSTRNNNNNNPKQNSTVKQFRRRCNLSISVVGVTPLIVELKQSTPLFYNHHRHSETPKVSSSNSECDSSWRRTNVYQHIWNVPKHGVTQDRFYSDVYLNITLIQTIICLNLFCIGQYHHLNIIWFNMINSPVNATEYDWDLNTLRCFMWFKLNINISFVVHLYSFLMLILSFNGKFTVIFDDNKIQLH